MSSQLIELIIFAAIAFFVITKLISVLGTTHEDDPAKRKDSFFGEKSSNIKDVTGTSSKFGSKSAKIINATFIDLKGQNLKDLIVPEHKDEIAKSLKEVNLRMPSFNLSKFLKGARLAFKMILSSDEAGLSDLVDKRYINIFTSLMPTYGNFQESAAVNAQVSEIYMFGNNIFVKVLFFGKNITDKIKDLHEEWTFTKNILSSNPEWHLSNIDRPH